LAATYKVKDIKVSVEWAFRITEMKDYDTISIEEFVDLKTTSLRDAPDGPDARKMGVQ
jgi:hypothetical protein